MNESVKGILLEAVQAASGESRLIDDLELTTLCIEKVSDEIEISNSAIRETLNILNAEEDTALSVLSGKERLRCFDSSLMSHSYGEALNFAAEGDSLKTIAETVRKESRLYPRPCISEMFLSSPYNIEAEKLQDTIHILVSDVSNFKDICLAKASNGDIYLYSQRYMNKSRAEYLAEWESVESLESQ
ncbi:hypothetical protein [Oceanispirochaeta sp.]|jgi:hypothetical protein|uniref:hypothetical protein n=1 Tax=Oceanispirochaeta sp. TaxID=2035350 RepID=UPI00262D86C8|nr:hypothetical protein [Oceanispirochaeta sp.]MDA3956796.1 hypothetical protein [Oceanispirochaeta sp.]